MSERASPPWDATPQDASDSGNGGFAVLGRTHTTGESKELRDAYDASGVSNALGLFDESRLTCEASAQCGVTNEP